MSRLQDYLNLLGWRWLAVFLICDAVAVASVAMSVRDQKRKWAAWCLRTSAAATLVSVGATIAACASGFNSVAQPASAELAPSAVIAGQFDGTAVVLNNAIWGIANTVFTLSGAFICLGGVLAGAKRPKAHP
jgi:hypothetical protein